MRNLGRLHYHSRTMSEKNSAAARSEHSRLLIYFLVEYLCSIGQPLLTMGIFFFTHNRLGWGLRANLLLAMGEGAVYTIGAMLASMPSKLRGAALHVGNASNKFATRM